MVKRERYRGEDCLVLENEALRVVILPGRGGNIASFYDKEIKRELLHECAQNPLPPVPQNLFFEDGSCAGIDDMFPNIAAVVYQDAPFEGQNLPDHGEVWFSPMCCIAEDGAVTLELMGCCLPFRYQKRFSVEGRKLQIQYEVVNVAEAPFHYIWAAHPLFAADREMQLCLPEEDAGVFDFVICSDPSLLDNKFTWPSLISENGQTRDVSHMGELYGLSGKVVNSVPMKAGWCALWDERDRYGIEMQYDAKMLPFLQFWFDLKNTCVAAPEPSTQRSGRLHERDIHDTGFLLPSQRHSWWVEYTVGTAIPDQKNKLQFEHKADKELRHGGA